MAGKIKILVVEDDDSIRGVYAEKLRSEGFAVFVARNGQEGLDLALREKPNLILLDLLMPIMDGLAMMNSLRGKGGQFGKDVPVIFLTNLPPDEEKIMQSIVKHEPAYYLIKSQWNLNQIVEKIRERLSR